MKKEFSISDIKIIDDKVKPEELLSGDIIKGLSSNSKVAPNTEVEVDEYVQFPGDDTTQKVVGKSHETGGVKVNIPDNTAILSDNLKLTAKQAKLLSNEYGIKVTVKNTYAEALDKFISKIGLKKLSLEQQDLFKALKKEMDKMGIDPKTNQVNTEYLANKIHSFEEKKKPLEQEKATFFKVLFDMQESTKPAEEREIKENGGLSKKNFEALCKMHGITPEQGMKMLRDGGYSGEIESFADGGEKEGDKGGIFVSKDQMLPTGDSLTDEQKKELLAYYRGHNTGVANAIDNGTVKWEDITLNSGLVAEASRLGYLQTVPVFTQPKDKSTNYLPNAKTYGSLSQERVSGFVLKDYYEAKNPGKKFENITPEEVKALQQDYNDALTGAEEIKSPYFSGADGEKQVADSYFGNRTSSYIRAVGRVTGKKQGTIDVDKLFTQSPEQIDAQLEEYGLTHKDIEKYKNSAYKYVQIGQGDVTDPAEDTPAEGEAAKTVNPDGTPITDTVKVPAPGNSFPRAYFTPDQSVLPPSAMDAHLKGDVRLERIDPLRIGIEKNLQEISSQRNFVASQLEGLPETVRTAVLANLLATSNKSANDAITSANVTNAQNISQAELFNIGQSEKEQTYGVYNALSFEQRQMTAKANTEEALGRYYDYNRKVNVQNFKDTQNLNLMQTMFPDFKLNYSGTGVDFEPASEFEIKDMQNILELKALLGK